jgi:hypothetical protein
MVSQATKNRLARLERRRFGARRRAPRPDQAWLEHADIWELRKLEQLLEAGATCDDPLVAALVAAAHARMAGHVVAPLAGPPAPGELWCPPCLDSWRC